MRTHTSPASGNRYAASSPVARIQRLRNFFQEQPVVWSKLWQGNPYYVVFQETDCGRIILFITSSQNLHIFRALLGTCQLGPFWRKPQVLYLEPDALLLGLSLWIATYHCLGDQACWSQLHLLLSYKVIYLLTVYMHECKFHTICCWSITHNYTINANVADRRMYISASHFVCRAYLMFMAVKPYTISYCKSPVKRAQMIKRLCSWEVSNLKDSLMDSVCISEVSLCE